jgi:hypothetical protein
MTDGGPDGTGIYAGKEVLTPAARAGYNPPVRCSRGAGGPAKKSRLGVVIDAEAAFVVFTPEDIARRLPPCSF